MEYEKRLPPFDILSPPKIPPNSLLHIMMANYFLAPFLNSPLLIRYHHMKSSSLPIICFFFLDYFFFFFSFFCSLLDLDQISRVYYFLFRRSAGGSQFAQICPCRTGACGALCALPTGTEKMLSFLAKMSVDPSLVCNWPSKGIIGRIAHRRSGNFLETEVASPT